jgi:TMEM175 potassium channel family protein
LLFLLFVVVLPFFSNLLGTYGQIPIAEALCATVVAGIGLSLLALWAYACQGHRLVDKELDVRFIRGTYPLAIGAPATFLISVPIAFVQPSWAPIVWWLTPVLGIAAARYTRQRAALEAKGR